MAFDAAVAVESSERVGVMVTIVSAWQGGATKRWGFNVSTADGTAQLTIDLAAPGLMRLGAMLPSGRSYSAEIYDELAAFAREASDEDELAGHLRTALAFVVRCFDREGMEKN